MSWWSEHLFTKKLCFLYSPTKVFQTGSSGIFNCIIYLSTSVWKVSTDKWIILFPLVSVFLQLAPRENRYWIVSRAPEVAASNSGVHWFLKIKEYIVTFEHRECQIDFLLAVQSTVVGTLIHTTMGSSLWVVTFRIPPVTHSPPLLSGPQAPFWLACHAFSCLR